MKKQKICIITFVSTQSGLTFLSNFLKVLDPMAEISDIIICTPLAKRYFNFGGPIIHVINYKIQKKFILIRIARQLWLQLMIIRFLIKNHRSISKIIFFFGSDQALPVLIAKVFRIKTVLVVTGSIANSAKETIGYLAFIIYRLLERITFCSIDRVIVYSSNVINDYRLVKYRSKILVAPHHHLDFTRFKIITPLKKRKDIVGFAGRLSEEKGVLNLVRAIPQILDKKKNLKFLFAGDGHLRLTIEDFILNNKLGKSVRLLGWLNHQRMPKYLNQLKLLVLPSYAGEGLPNIVIEAMACGTPILVTPVGSILDIIRDGKNGYILKSNTAKNIQKVILSVLQKKNPEKVIKTARNYTNHRFNYRLVQDRYKAILRA